MPVRWPWLFAPAFSGRAIIFNKQTSRLWTESTESHPTTHVDADDGHMADHDAGEGHGHDGDEGHMEDHDE